MVNGDGTWSDAVLVDPILVPWRELYRRLVEIVVPRPIALVSTVSAAGRPNLAPFSFFTVVSANPPYLAFAPQLSGRTGVAKDTLRNVEDTGELVIAAVDESIAGQVNACAAPLPYGASEFEHAGLTPAPASRVRAHLVAESKVNMECELVEIRRYGDGPGAGSLVVARIVLVHVAPGLVDEHGGIRPEALRPVGRMGGSMWVRALDTFSLERPE